MGPSADFKWVVGIFYASIQSREPSVLETMVRAFLALFAADTHAIGAQSCDSSFAGNSIVKKIYDVQWVPRYLSEECALVSRGYCYFVTHVSTPKIRFFSWMRYLLCWERWMTERCFCFFLQRKQRTVTLDAVRDEHTCGDEPVLNMLASYHWLGQNSVPYYQNSKELQSTTNCPRYCFGRFLFNTFLF